MAKGKGTSSRTVKSTGRSYTKPPARRPPPPNPNKVVAGSKQMGPNAIQARPSFDTQKAMAPGAIQARPNPAAEIARVASAAQAARIAAQLSSGGGPTSQITATPPPVPQVTQPTIANAAVPQVTSTTGPSSMNTSAGSFQSSGGGGGTYGQFERQRQNRGPRTGMSLTPELLRRAAASRLRG